MPRNSIILAEDDEGLRTSCLRHFQMHLPPSVGIRTAGSRATALQLIAETDAVQTPAAILDLRLPKRGDGEAIAIAALAKGIAVIVFSGSLEDLSESIRNQCRAVFDKSEGFDLVIESLKQCLSIQ